MGTAEAQRAQRTNEKGHGKRIKVKEKDKEVMPSMRKLNLQICYISFSLRTLRLCGEKLVCSSQRIGRMPKNRESKSPSIISTPSLHYSKKIEAIPLLWRVFPIA